MKRSMLLDKYPVYSTELAKSDIACRDADEVMARLRADVEAHPAATYIGEFDHYAHVAAQAEGQIADGIKAAKHILFCVANAIPNPVIGAARPRSVSVTEMEDKFVISYLEAPVDKVNDRLAQWVDGLKSA